jgi:hypothetical protein
MVWKHLPRWFIIIDRDDSCLALMSDDPWFLGVTGQEITTDVALARSSDRYGKFDWWSHDVGDPIF